MKYFVQKLFVYFYSKRSFVEFFHYSISKFLQKGYFLNIFIFQKNTIFTEQKTLKAKKALILLSTLSQRRFSIFVNILQNIFSQTFFRILFCGFSFEYFFADFLSNILARIFVRIFFSRIFFRMFFAEKKFNNRFTRANL